MMLSGRSSFWSRVCQRLTNRVDSEHEVEEAAWTPQGAPIVHGNNTDGIKDIAPCFASMRLETLDIISVHLQMQTKVIYAEMAQSGITRAFVMVTMAEKGTQHTLAGYGSVPLSSLDQCDAILCLQNTEPGNISFVPNVQHQEPYSAMKCATCGLCLYAGIRLKTFPALCACYLVFEPVLDQDILSGMQEYLENAFVGFDDVLKQYMQNSSIDSLRQQKECGRIAHDTAKRVHLLHEEQIDNLFKNSFLSLEHELKCTTHANLELSMQNMKRITAEGIHACMQVKVSKLMRYGEYKPVLQWMHANDVTRRFAVRDRVLVEAQADLMVRTDESLLSIIVQKLISNAIRHGQENKPVRMLFLMDCGKVVVHVVNEPGRDHEAVMKMCESLESSATTSPNMFETLLKLPGENAASRSSSSSQGLVSGLRGVKLCTDTLKAFIGIYFYPQRVVATVSLTDTFKFSAKTAFDDFPVIACLDDSSVQRKMLHRICAKTKAANESFVAGSSMAEIRAFPMRVVSSPAPVTHCVIDQHLTDPAGVEDTILGTDVIAQLKTRGYAGCCIIRSANDSPACQAFYREHGADDFLSKTTTSLAAFVQVLKGGDV